MRVGYGYSLSPTLVVGILAASPGWPHFWRVGFSQVLGNQCVSWMNSYIYIYNQSILFQESFVQHIHLSLTYTWNTFCCNYFNYSKYCQKMKRFETKTIRSSTTHGSFPKAPEHPTWVRQPWCARHLSDHLPWGTNLLGATSMWWLVDYGKLLNLPRYIMVIVVCSGKFGAQLHEKGII